MNTQKNDTLELLKLFASYMVVFIHVQFYGNFGIAIDALSRFAVPFFFLVSGYYSYQISCEKIKKRMKNILTLLAFSSICCTAFEIVKWLKYNRDELVLFLNQYTDLSTYVKLLVFNEPVSSGHLWYLLAAFYVYVLFYFATKFQIKEKVMVIISLFLLLAHLLLGEGLSIFGIVVPISLVRNFALMGIPFFVLGLFVKKYENKIRTVPNYMIFLFAAIGIFESIISRFCFGENELHIGSLFVLTAFVCLFLKCADVKYPSFLKELEGCSTYIYIFHIIISTVIYIFYGMVGIDFYSSVTLQNLHPIIVCVASTVFSYLFIKISRMLSKNNV